MDPAVRAASPQPSQGSAYNSFGSRADVALQRLAAFGRPAQPGKPATPGAQLTNNLKDLLNAAGGARSQTNRRSLGASASTGSASSISTAASTSTGSRSTETPQTTQVDFRRPAASSPDSEARWAGYSRFGSRLLTGSSQVLNAVTGGRDLLGQFSSEYDAGSRLYPKTVLYSATSVGQAMLSAKSAAAAYGAGATAAGIVVGAIGITGAAAAGATVGAGVLAAAGAAYAVGSGVNYLRNQISSFW